MEGDDDDRNERARKAYQALLTVTARTPDTDEYREFSREVKSLAQSKYNFTFGNNSVSTFVAAFYDAVLLYALALKESLPEKPGEVNLDGSNLTKRMWGKSFKGKRVRGSCLLAAPLSRPAHQFYLYALFFHLFSQFFALHKQLNVSCSCLFLFFILVLFLGGNK